MMSAITSFLSSLWLHGSQDLWAWLTVSALALLAGVWIRHFWGKGSPSPTPPGVAQVWQQLDKLQREQDAIKRLLCLDELTGLPNGRYLEQVALPAAISSCAASGHPLTVAFLDFDHFGAYNKRHGHDAGDRLLVQGVRQAQLRLSQGRCTDQMFRFYSAGDEFVILLPGADATRADTTLTLVRSFLAAAGISVSIGAVVLRPGERMTARALLASADAAMREVKRAGRGGPPNIRQAQAIAEHREPAMIPSRRA